MAAGGKAAEIRAGVVVLVGLAILGIGLYLVSGGAEQLKPKSRLTVCFDNAGGISTGADVYVAGQKAGHVTKVETVLKVRDGERRRFVALTIEIGREFQIPEDSRFTISRSITNVVTFNIDYGVSNRIAEEDSDLFGERLATFEELVDAAEKLVDTVRKGAEDFDALILEAQAKVKQLDVEGLQGEMRELLASLREAAADIRALVRDSREPVRRAIGNVEELSARLRGDWDAMRGKVQGIVDDTRETAADVKGIVKENREGLKSIVQQLDDGIRRLGPALAQVEALGRDANDAVAELRPELRRAVASGRRALADFEAAAADLRTAPWKLVNKPSGRESDDVHLYNAARLYTDAAGEVASAIQDLDTLRRLGVLGDPGRRDLIEKTLTAMQEALASFEAHQKAFVSLIAATADRRR